MKNRLLFVLKKRQVGPYGSWAYSGGSSGLLISAQLVVDMLNGAGIEAFLVEVNDNNEIDREIVKYKPNYVIIEAFWVVPDKFDILKRLHPKIQWIVRDHSKTAFLANEGIAFGWSIDYLKRGIEIACNSLEGQSDMQSVARAAGAQSRLVTYLPNYYPIMGSNPLKRPRTLTADVGCFGAIRPLKNQMVQAVAAIKFAYQNRLRLRFHINANRVEGRADPILKNMRQTFLRMPFYELVEHDWMDHTKFLALMKTMDISLQVAYSETFNIVTADAIASDVPVLVSSEIPYLDRGFYADPNDTDQIADMMTKIWRAWFPRLRLANQRLMLGEYSAEAKKEWVSRFR